MTLGNSSSFEVQAPCDQAAARPVVRRVFHLIDSFNVGGTETQAVELARRLPATGYEVTVGCLKREGPLEDRLQGTGIAIREFRSRGGIDSPSGLRQLLRMSWFLRSFDIVHTHDLWSNLVGVPAARLAGIPAIVSSRRDLSHLEWYQGKRRVCLKWIQNLGGAVVTNAAPIRDVLLGEDRFDPRKVRVIHNGVDVAKFKSARKDRIRLFQMLETGNWSCLSETCTLTLKAILGSSPRHRRCLNDSRTRDSSWSVMASNGRASRGRLESREFCRVFSLLDAALIFRKYSLLVTLQFCPRAQKGFRTRFSNTWRRDCRSS